MPKPIASYWLLRVGDWWQQRLLAAPDASLEEVRTRAVQNYWPCRASYTDTIHYHPLLTITPLTKEQYDAIQPTKPIAHGIPISSRSYRSSDS